MRHREDEEPDVGRGVFLDVPRALGMEVLPDGHAITSEELDRTAKKEA